jgi:hypothetical protein
MPARPQLGVLSSFAALASILLITACGGSSKPAHSGGHGSPFIAFSKCMRAHGITNFPDPSGGGGLNIAGTGINPSSPAFKTAQGTCFKLMPGGGPNSHKASEQEIRQATTTAECMRSHGVSGYPDPIISTGLPSSLNQANYSSISAGGGIIIAIPKSINPQSPVFQKAAKICNARGG